MSKKQLSVYVHVPYCYKKCRYCDFVSFENRYGSEIRYAEKLIEELSQYSLDDYTVRSVFIGGGTPSSVDENAIALILEAIRKKAELADNCEITVECNPCSTTPEKLAFYRNIGINRISIGIQSFNDDVLKTLGRLHDSEKAVQCVQNARKAGFDNISTDLMFSIPGQTAEDVLASIKQSSALGVNHISLYSLIIEEGTPLEKMISKGELTPVDDETDRRMYSDSVALLDSLGYKQYEISNFAQNGKASVHNTTYWERKEYIGLGVAAHSFFDGKRYSNTENYDEYMRGVDVNEKLANGEEIGKTDAAEETVMLGLRMNKGFSVEEFKNASGFDITERCKEQLTLLIDEGLIAFDGKSIRATAKGRDVLNKLIVDIVSGF